MEFTYGDVSVGVVDNDPFALDMVVSMLHDHEAPVRVLWAVTSARDALTMCSRRSLRPDVVLTDMQMPDVDGSELAMSLVRDYSHEVRVVGMTAFDDSNTLYDFPVLPKEAPITQFVRTIGEVVDDVQVAQWNDVHDRGIILSQSELHTVSLIAQGLTLAAVAGRLHVSETTVKTYLSRVFHKLHVHTKAEAIAFCVRRSWL